MKKSVEFMFLSDKNGAVSDLVIQIPLAYLEELIANARKLEPISDDRRSNEVPIVITRSEDV
jgi:hypothetical protein